MQSPRTSSSQPQSSILEPPPPIPGAASSQPKRFPLRTQELPHPNPEAFLLQTPEGHTYIFQGVLAILKVIFSTFLYILQFFNCHSFLNKQDRHMKFKNSVIFGHQKTLSNSWVEVEFQSEAELSFSLSQVCVELSFSLRLSWVSVWCWVKFQFQSEAELSFSLRLSWVSVWVKSHSELSWVSVWV